jgi:hypothetical protein
MGSSRPKKIRCVYRARSVKNGRVDNGRRAVLKTVGCKSFAGSNPVPSALNFFVLLAQSGKERRPHKAMVSGSNPEGNTKPYLLEVITPIRDKVVDNLERQVI